MVCPYGCKGTGVLVLWAGGLWTFNTKPDDNYPKVPCPCRIEALERRVEELEGRNLEELGIPGSDH